MNKSENIKKELTLRQATSKDALIIFKFIKQLAAFEKLSHQVKTTPAELRKNLFGRKPVAKVLLAFLGAEPVGFALYFYNFSTFLGKPGVYLEDLFVLPKYRSFGIGLKLLNQVIAHAHKHHCGRVEWSVLNWNHRAISFYQNLGAKPLKEWTVFRLQLQPQKKRAAAAKGP
jgi:GNAT superfamily N-acetyltransferase